MVETQAVVRRVLVADDDPSVLRPLVRALELSGYSTHVAHDGFQARDAIARDTYDVLLTDINMPGNEHLELLSSQQGQNPVPPTILITGYPRFETAVMALRMGAIDYLTKPIDPAAVIEKVQRVITLQRAFTELDEANRRILAHSSWLLRGRDPTTEELEPANMPSPGPTSVERKRDQLDADVRGISCLSPREREVAAILACGYSMQEVAERLRISKNTVRNHAKSIFTKLGVSSQAELIARIAGYRT